MLRGELITGIIHFSRWALFLLWLISGLGLTARQILTYSMKARKQCAGEDPPKCRASLKTQYTHPLI